MTEPQSRRGAASAPRDLRGRVFDADGRRYAVLWFSREASRNGGLTAAEREVATLIVAGRSNAEIARARRTSVRTVANQVASVFRKLHVDSRGDLVAHFDGSEWL